MRRGIHPFAVIAIAAGVGILSIGSRGLEPQGWNAAENQREVVRIQADLARAETELRATDTSQLTASQRQNRARNLEWLHQYWSAGHFPHNHDFPHRAAWYFQDRHGTLCPVAFLIAQSGRQYLVDRMAALNNNGSVFDIAADPRIGPTFRAWLTDAGLTLDEAARIEPQYTGF